MRRGAVLPPAGLRRARHFRCGAGPAVLALAALAACDREGDEPALSVGESAEALLAEVPTPPADGPKLGAIANVIPVLDRPSLRGERLGYLHAGSRVSRAEEPYTTRGCSGGWYPIRPRGFVCAGAGATLEPTHPTLTARSIQPKLDEPMPYAYARTTQQTTRYKVDAERETAVLPEGTLPRASGMAVVGSWEADDPEGRRLRLAMTTDGHFVDVAHLKAAEPSSFRGVELGDGAALPVAYVVKRGVRTWALEGKKPEPRRDLEYHDRLSLTGRYRTLDGERFWAASTGEWVRHRDVTVIRRRSVYPDFASGDRKWIDVSIITGTLVLYEGQVPVYATLVSAGRDRLGDPETTDSTERGTFTVAAKHVTGANLDPRSAAAGVHLYDLPWVVELSPWGDDAREAPPSARAEAAPFSPGRSSRALLHGAYWHDRFGIEHGPGSLQLSPADALRVWRWVEPSLPEGWHAVAGLPGGEASTVVHVRK